MTTNVQAAPSGLAYERLGDSSIDPGAYVSFEVYEMYENEWHLVGYWECPENEEEKTGFDFLSVTRTEAEALADLSLAEQRSAAP